MNRSDWESSNNRVVGPSDFDVEPLQLGSDRPRLEHVRVRGIDLGPGDRVILRPAGRADAFDLLLAGRFATIESIEQDYEDRIYLAVTIDDDPGKDLGLQRKPGHRFFYSPDDLEPVGDGEHAR